MSELTKESQCIFNSHWTCDDKGVSGSAGKLFQSRGPAVMSAIFAVCSYTQW